MSSNDFIIQNGVLEKYKGKGGDVVIPEGITKIGHGAFYGCANVTNIKLPESLTSIDKNAFAYCSGLTNMVIPPKVTRINARAF